MICTICTHAALKVIDRELVTGGANISALGRRHQVSRQALLRHRDGGHIPKALTDARADVAPDRTTQVLAKFAHLEDLVAGFIEAAQARGDVRGATTALREATRLVELIAKVQGDLQPAPLIQINLADTTEFRSVVARIIEALQDEPVARAKVSAALRIVN